MLAIITVFILLVLTSIHAKSLFIDLYPGYGWDHLRFIDMLPIFNVRNSNDSAIIQQCIAHIPLRETELEMNSDIIDIYDSSTKDYASKHILGGGVGFMGFGVSGSFSKQYRELKEKQGREQTVTIRNEVVQTVADVLLLRSCPLDHQLKSEIIEIANYIRTDQQIMAMYASQVFVLRYGTHYTSRFRIGGRIIEENFVKSQELYSSDIIKRSTQAGAKASFIGKFSLSASYGTSNSATTNDTQQFEQRTTQRQITSHGGQPYLMNMSLREWQSTVEDNPVILQRLVENITMAIDPKQIPEIEEYYVYKAIEEINRAIDTYVHMNLIPGCLDRTSNSFNWLANIDSGKCDGSALNMQFGGFLRTCDVYWTAGNSHSPPDGFCSRLSNFHTGTGYCPTGFTQNLLHTSSRTQRIERVESYRCGFLWFSTCHRTIWVGTGTMIAKLYSCTRNSVGVTQYTFGGWFTSNKINLITNSRTCPAKFVAHRIVNDIDVCLTDQIVYSSIIPKFGGMFSCQTTHSTTGNADMCPKGFNDIPMGVIESSCILYVCLQLQAKDRQLPPISLPPYFNLIDQINMTLLMKNDSNATENDDLAMPTIRMSPRIIYQDLKSVATKQYKTQFFFLLPILILTTN